MTKSNVSQLEPILIAGAGIGGLTAALALLRRGIEVRVFEQTKELREVGAGVQISPNGSRVLDDLGVLETVRSKASLTEGKEIRLWDTGQTWRLFDLGEQAVRLYGYNYFTVYRVDLHNALIESVLRADPNAIKLNSRVTGFTQSVDGVTLQLEEGQQVVGRALIGADGIHSTVRSGLFGPEQAKYADMIAWRGIVPRERVPPHMKRPVGTNWVGPGGHVVHYPLRGGALMNFVGYLERSGWIEESWTVQGTTEECLADFAGWNEDVLALIRCIDVPFKWGLVRRPPLTTWTGDCVTLLGDACHAMYPFLAQGAVMAMEDGLVLARCVEANPHDMPSALLAYEAARIDRTRRVVEGSADNVRRFHNAVLGHPVEGPLYVQREWATERVQDRYEWIFKYDATHASLENGTPRQPLKEASE
jgi:salicylate hydroxylase